MPIDLSDVRITASPHPTESHWAHIRPAAEHLRHELAFMRALVALSQDAATEADLRALDLEPQAEDYSDPYELALSVLDGWSLEIINARWQHYAHTNLARVYVVLGTGGPHVELDILCDTRGYAESIELRRYWSQSDSARTTDGRALEYVDGFISAFLEVE